MAARKPGRYLAPIALLAIAAAIGLVVKDHIHHSSHVPTTSQNQGGSLVQSIRHQPKARHHRAKVYTVKQGDTLSAIAQATGVPSAIIQSLNPSINPDALQPGQRLRLRR